MRLYIGNNILSSIMLWVQNTEIKFGVGEHHFRNYHIYASSHIFGSSRGPFSFYFDLELIRFLKSLKISTSHR